MSAPVPAEVTIGTHGVDLTAAARWVLMMKNDGVLGQTAYRAALGVWLDLTGLDEARAIEYAETVAAADSPVTAHIRPF